MKKSFKTSGLNILLLLSLIMITVLFSSLMKKNTAIKFNNNNSNLYHLKKIRDEDTSLPLIKTVIIGSQEWTKENLNVDKFRNGDPIPHAKTSEEWRQAGYSKQPAWCYYNNDEKIGKKTGKLYNWYAVNDPRRLAPRGFHIPSKEEWSALIKYLGYTEISSKMKQKGVYETRITYKEEGGEYEQKWVACSNCSYWTEKQKLNNPCTVCKNKRGKWISTGKYIPKTKRKIEKKIKIDGWDGSNESGFSAIPSGMRYSDGSFHYINLSNDPLRFNYAFWWSSTADKSCLINNDRYPVPLFFYVSDRSYGGRSEQECASALGGRVSDGFSVRCIKD